MPHATAERTLPAVGVALDRNWQQFRGDSRRALAVAERCVRHVLTHDPRSASCRVAAIDPSEIASAAFGWALEERDSMPSSATPMLWMLRRALETLDERLDAAASGTDGASVRPGPAGAADAVERLRAMGVLDDESERARWLDLASAELDMTGEVSCGAACAAGDPARLAAIEQAITRLPERRRRVVELRLLDDLPTEDVAWLLDMTDDEVRRELASGLKAIRLGA